MKYPMIPVFLTALFVSSAAVAEAPSSAEGLAPTLTNADPAYTFHPASGTRDPGVQRRVPADAGEMRRHGLIWALHAGSYQGSASSSCYGVGCGTTIPNSDVSIASGSTFALEWMIHSSRHFRFGMDLGVLPNLRIRGGDKAYELGTLLTSGVVMEGVIDISPKLALTPRVQVDGGALVATGDLETFESDNDPCRALDDRELRSECEKNREAGTSAQIGAGAGVLYNLGRVGLRVDAQVQGFVLTTGHSTLAGWRPMLTAGLEI